MLPRQGAEAIWNETPKRHLLGWGMSRRWTHSNKGKRNIRNFIQGCWFKRILWLGSQWLEANELLGTDVWLQRQCHTAGQLSQAPRPRYRRFAQFCGFLAPVLQRGPCRGRQFPALVCTGSRVLQVWPLRSPSFSCFHSSFPSCCWKSPKFLP